MIYTQEGVFNIYKCKHCGAVVSMESTKAWIKSYCEKTGKNVRLVRVDNKTQPNLTTNMNQENDKTKAPN